MRLIEKTSIFLENIRNAYLEENEKEITTTLSFPQPGDDYTEDVTSLLVAMHLFVQYMTNNDDDDLIGFTHLLNRLAIQFCANKERN